MADPDPKASHCTATSKTTGNLCTRPAIPGVVSARITVARLPTGTQEVKSGDDSASHAADTFRTAAVMIREPERKKSGEA